MRVSVLTHSVGDLATLAEYGATKADIANAFHVPLSYLTTETNLANLEAAEHQHMSLAIAPRLLLAHLRRSFPNVRDVHLSRGGVGRYHLYVQIRKRQEGEAKNVMLGAFAGHYDIKHVVVVDEDVDIHDPAEVEWAVATRFQADQDLVIVPNSQGSKLDPSTRNGVGAKMGLDATKPLSADDMTFKRIRVPGEENVRVDELLDGPRVDWREALKS